MCQRFFNIALCLCFLASCKSESPVVPVLLPQRVFTFPVTVNSMWQFAIEDTVTKTRDTVIVRALGSLKDPVSHTFLQMIFTQHSHRIPIDRSYDTLRFDFTPQAWGATFSLIYPLDLNKSWPSTICCGDVFVSRLDTVICPAGTFYFSTKLILQDDIPQEDSRVEYWIEPEIGVVKIANFYDSGNSIEKAEFWTLLSYYIAPQ